MLYVEREDTLGDCNFFIILYLGSSIFQIIKVSMKLPNIHYVPFDLSPFPSEIGGTQESSGGYRTSPMRENKPEVFKQLVKPSGMIQGSLVRNGYR